MRRWYLHVCLLDKDCRRWGAPPRVHINTPWFHLGLAFTPGAKFARGRNRSTWWDIR